MTTTATPPESIEGKLADALVTALESAPAQAALTEAVTAGEVEIKKIGDDFISNAKGSGFIGTIIAVGKGSVESEFDAELAKLTPAEIVAWITAKAVAEAKALGG